MPKKFVQDAQGKHEVIYVSQGMYNHGMEWTKVKEKKQNEE